MTKNTAIPKDMVTNKVQVAVTLVETETGCGVEFGLKGTPQGNVANIWVAMLLKEMPKTISSIHKFMIEHPRKCLDEAVEFNRQVAREDFDPLDLFEET